MRTLNVLFLLALAVPLHATDWSQWRMAAKQSRVEQYLGRESLLLDGAAWLDSANFRDGTIEFDVAAPGVTAFHGVAFRAADDGNFELFYLRYHLSDKPDATQYTPVFNGIWGWQIYSDTRYTQPATIAPDRWVHVELRVRGSAMQVLVDGKPLVFPHLVRPPAAGGIGLMTGITPAHFTNVVVRPDVAAFEEKDTAPALPAGTIARWRVSNTFAEGKPPAALQWDALDSGDTGIANLASLRKWSKENNTVFAAVTLHAKKAGEARLKFGYSDRVVITVNGRVLYRGNSAFQARDHSFLGTVGLFDELVLPLVRGDNEVRFAVSENFGGWAVAAQLVENPDVGIAAAQLGSRAGTLWHRSAGSTSPMRTRQRSPAASATASPTAARTTPRSIRPTAATSTASSARPRPSAATTSSRSRASKN